MSELVLVVDPMETMRILDVKIKQHRKDLKDHPTYGNALKLQSLIHDREQIVARLRGDIKLITPVQDAEVAIT